jgi:hypothetical protein
MLQVREAEERRDLSAAGGHMHRAVTSARTVVVMAGAGVANVRCWGEPDKSGWYE